MTVYTLWAKYFVKIDISRTVSKINVFCVLSRHSRCQPKMMGKQFSLQFSVKVADVSGYTLAAKHFIEITLFRSFSEILKIFHFHCQEKLWRLIVNKSAILYWITYKS